MCTFLYHIITLLLSQPVLLKFSQFQQNNRCHYDYFKNLSENEHRFEFYGKL